MNSSPIAIGAFDLLELLGRGGMAEVWRGVHRRQQVPVALKIMTSTQALETDFRDALRHEVRAIAGLDHPNIVTVFDYGEIDLRAHPQAASRFPQGTPYIAMELATGGTLRQVRQFDWPLVKRVLLSILDALAHAHARGVIHLDLKPANVLVSDGPGGPVYKLADFGIAYINGQPLSAADLESTTERRLPRDKPALVQGTPPYMAPEQLSQGYRDFGPWTDLYALGCLAYGLVSGAPPFNDPDYRKIAEAHHRTPPPPLRPRMEIPAGFEAWVRCLLEKQPGRRFQRAADAAWALERLDDPGELLEVWELDPIDEPGEAEGDGPATGPTLIHDGTIDPPAADGSAGGSGVPKSAVPVTAVPASAVPASAVPASAVPASAVPASAVPAIASGPAIAAGPLGPVITPSPAIPPVPNVAPAPAGAPFPPDAPRVPPLPASWHRESSSRRPLTLAGAGLGLYGLRTVPLAGRRKERDVIWQALADVRKSGTARLILLHGAAGTGKSRLAEWICQRAHEVGSATVFKALHSPVDGSTEGLTRMVVQHLRCAGLDRDQVRARVSRVLLEQGVNDDYEWNALTEVMSPSSDETLTGHRARPSEETPRAIRFERPSERYALIGRLISRAAAQRPAIVWMDDVQWGSDALSFAEHLMQHQDHIPIPVLLILTVQDEALAERPIETVQIDELIQRPHATRLQVMPLAHGEQSTLVRDLLGLEGPLASRVVERTGGNPLFAVQLVRDWVERDLLELGPAGFRLKPGVTAQLPGDLHEVWAERIDRLIEGRPPGARVALELAAALGQEVNNREWRAVCKLAGIDVPDGMLEMLLDTLLANRLAQSTAMGRGGLHVTAWSFVHGMLRESLERLSRDAGRWQDQKWLCGTMLLELYPLEQAGIYERLGRYALDAGELEAALKPLLKAAQAHRRRGDLRLAHRLLTEREGAIAALGLPASDPREAEGWLLRGEMYNFQGRIKEAGALLDRVEISALQHDWLELQAEAMRIKAKWCLERGDPVQAIQIQKQALQLFEQLGNRRRVANCLIQLANGEHDRGNMAVAANFGQQALALNQELGDTRGEADCYLILGHISLLLRQERQAASLLQKAISHYTRVGYQPGVAQSVRCLGATLAPANPDQAAEMYRWAMSIFEKLGYPSGEAKCRNDLAELARNRGDLDGAEDGYRRTLAMVTHLQSGDVVVVRINLGLVLLARGRYREARAMIEPLRLEVEAMGRQLLLGAIHAILLPCAAAERDWAGWDRHFAQVVTLLTGTGVVEPDDAWAVQLGGELAAGAGERVRARQAFAFAGSLWRKVKRGDKADEAARLAESLEAG